MLLWNVCSIRLRRINIILRVTLAVQFNFPQENHVIQNVLKKKKEFNAMRNEIQYIYLLRIEEREKTHADCSLALLLNLFGLFGIFAWQRVSHVLRVKSAG